MLIALLYTGILITMTEPTADALRQIMEVADTLYHLIEERVSIHLQFLMLQQKVDWDGADTLRVRILGQKLDVNQEAVLEAVPTLIALLGQYGYVNRGLSTFAYDTPKYAVHPEWVETYDKGLYHHESRTWDDNLGEVPGYALLHLEP
jgi:hypothetical protein